MVQPPIAKLNLDRGNGKILPEFRNDANQPPEEMDGDAINNILSYDELEPLFEGDNEQW